MERVYQGMEHLSGYIQSSNLFSDILNWIGWNLLVCIARLMDGAYAAVNTLLGINILEIAPIAAIAEKISPLGWILMTLALILGAILLMINPDKLKINDFVRGTLLAIVFIIAIPFTFQTLNQLKTAGMTDLESMSVTNSNSTIGKDLLRSLTWDIDESQNSLKNISSDTNPYYLDINEKLDRSSPWEYKVQEVIESGNSMQLMGKELSSGFLGIGEENVYAYHFDFVNGFIILLVSLVALVFVGFKISRLIFDLCFYQIISPVIFATDLHSTGRSKKFIQTLISSYLIFIILLLLFKLYMDLSLWISLQNFNFMVRILILAGAAKGLIDGPDLIVRLLGIDAGVKNGMGTIIGINTAMRTVSEITRTAANFGSKAFSMVKSAPAAVSQTAGASAGMGKMQENIQKGASAQQGKEFGSYAAMKTNQKKETSAEPSAFNRGQQKTGGLAQRIGYLGSRAGIIQSNNPGTPKGANQSPARNVHTANKPNNSGMDNNRPTYHKPPPRNGGKK